MNIQVSKLSAPVSTQGFSYNACVVNNFELTIDGKQIALGETREELISLAATAQQIINDRNSH